MENVNHIAIFFFIVVPCALIAVMLFKLLMNEVKNINKKAALEFGQLHDYAL